MIASLSEKRWVWMFALLVVLITSIPYLIALEAQSEQWAFSGFLIGVEDGNSYIAKMLRGSQGDWLFKSPYSAEEQGGALLYLPYLLLGKILGPSAKHAQLVVLFHVFRMIATFLLCLASYAFLSHFLQRVTSRRLSLALMMLGGGLGWLLLILGMPDWLGSLPLDFYSPETFGFLAVFGLPHLSLARALMLWGLLFYLRRNELLISPIALGLLWLTMALLHLLSALIGLFVIAIHFLVMHFASNKIVALAENSMERRQRLIHSLWPLLGSALPILINLFFLARDDYLQAWATQNQITSPHFLHYFIAYTVMLPFAFYGASHLMKNQAKSASVLIAWLLALPVLLYIPLGLQRRFAEGAWLALTILAIAAFESKKFNEWQHWRWIFSLAFPSTLMLLFGAIQVARFPSAPAFQSKANVQLFEELRAISSDGDVVLSSFEMGNAFPAWLPVRVVIGHGPESVGLAELQIVMSELLSGENVIQAMASFADYEPAYLIAEQHLMLADEIGFDLLGRFEQNWLYEYSAE